MRITITDKGITMNQAQPPSFPFSIAGTNIHFFDPNNSKLYVYRLNAVADLNVVHIDVDKLRQHPSWSNSNNSDECLLDNVKAIAVDIGLIGSHEEVAMVC